MSDRQECNAILPRPPAGAQEGDGFRESFLRHFPHPHDRRALRQLARTLYELTLAAKLDGPECEGSTTRAELVAIGRDLRFTGWLLAVVGRERIFSELSPEDAALSALAERLAADLDRIAGELEAAVAP
jgi:hypothetical protein